MPTPATLPHAITDHKTYYATTGSVLETKLPVVKMVLTNRQNQMFRISLFFPGVVYLLTVPLIWLFAVTVARETTFCIKELLHAVKERHQGNVVYRIHTCTLDGLRILYRECNRMMT